MTLPVAIQIGLGCLTIGMIHGMRHRAAGTTLLAPVIWAELAIGISMVLEALPALAGGQVTIDLTFVRQGKALLALAPILALLGAKRPQHRAWQLIVLAFLGVAFAPCLRSLLTRPGAHFQIHPIEFGLQIWLAVMGLVNYLPTRHALAAVLCGGGVLGSQLLAHRGIAESAAEFLNRRGISDFSWIGAVMHLLYFLGTAWIFLRLNKGPHGVSESDAAWLRFRDAFGALWGVRVAHRVNEVAWQKKHACRLEWNGFHKKSTDSSEVGAAPQPPDVPSELTQTLHALLGRFVRISPVVPEEQGA